MQVEEGVQQQGGGGLSAESVLSGIDLSAFAGAEDEVKPLGGTFGTHPSFLGPVNQPSGGPDPRSVRLPTPYTRTDVGNLWGSIATEDKVRVQQALIALGFINPTKFQTGRMQPGMLDPTTKSGFEDLLSMANAEGMRWQYLLDNLVTQRQQTIESGGAFAGFGGGGGGGGGGAKTPPFLPPDPATLRARATDAVKQTLGREPLPEELEALSKEFGSLARQQYDAAVAGGQQVDPAARFQELIDTKYADELDFINQRDEAVTAQARASQPLSIIDQMSSAGMRGLPT